MKREETERIKLNKDNKLYVRLMKKKKKDEKAEKKKEWAATCNECKQVKCTHYHYHVQRLLSDSDTSSFVCESC